MNEERFIEQLTNLTGPDSFLGDDSAILDSTGGSLLATVDSLSESVHYEGAVEPELLVKKLVGVNVSDIAAMGGLPKWALYAEGSLDESEVRQRKVRALHRELTNLNIDLIGGDTVGVSQDGCAYCSLTLLGNTHTDGVLQRTNAQTGERICVTGSLGGPAAVRATASVPWTETEQDVLYDPPNRVPEGQNLVEFGCRCAIDVSDGLIKDLKRILRQSEVGAKLDWTHLPVNERARDRARDRSELLKWALTGGEEFELLFTLPAGRESPEIQYTQIGHITDDDTLKWTPSLPEKIEFTSIGYDHFSN